VGILDGKIALITGAGQGVGAGIALALARQGAVIATAGRTESKLVRTCAAITEPLTDVGVVDDSAVRVIDLLTSVPIVYLVLI